MRIQHILSEVHKLLQLYITIPITAATDERTFSVQKQLLTYLRTTKKCLNNCLHAHKDVTDSLNLEDVAKEFISANVEWKRHLPKPLFN